MYFYTDYSTVESASLKPKVERDRGYAWVVLTASFMCQVGNCLATVDSLLHSSERANLNLSISIVQGIKHLQLCELHPTADVLWLK